MRVSTLFFLALFGTFVVGSRARHFACSAPWPTCSEPACVPESPCPPPRDNARQRELESELRRLQQRGRDLDRSLQAVTQSTRTLHDLIERHPDDGVRQDLAEIEAGRARLKELRDHVEIDRAALAARLELVRAGMPDPDDESAAEPDHRSPVEALSTSVPTPRISARVR